MIFVEVPELPWIMVGGCAGQPGGSATTTAGYRRRSRCGPRSIALESPRWGEPLLLVWSFFSPGSAWRRHFPHGRGPLCHAMSAATSSYDGGRGSRVSTTPVPQDPRKLGHPDDLCGSAQASVDHSGGEGAVSTAGTPKKPVGPGSKDRGPAAMLRRTSASSAPGRRLRHQENPDAAGHEQPARLAKPEPEASFR